MSWRLGIFCSGPKGPGPGRPHKGLSCGGHPCDATFTPTGVPFSFVYSYLVTTGCHADSSTSWVVSLHIHVACINIAIFSLKCNHSLEQSCVLSSYKPCLDTFVWGYNASHATAIGLVKVMLQGPKLPRSTTRTKCRAQEQALRLELTMLQS